MKKSILALALIGALSMLGACSSDNDNDNGSTVSGNFAKEPIMKAKLNLWRLADLGKVDAKPVNAEPVTTDAKGSFSFNVVGGETYVVVVAPNGLDEAVLMNVTGGTPLSDPSLASMATDFNQNTAIIATADKPAQLNPIGLAATKATMADLGIKKLAIDTVVDTEIVKQAGEIAAQKVDDIATNLAVISGLAGNNVNKETILNGSWSPNLEYVLQVVKEANIPMESLAVLDINLTSTQLSALPGAGSKAEKTANAAAESVAKETGTPPVKVEQDTVKKDEIIASYIFNTKDFTKLINKVNATNNTEMQVNGTILGVNLARQTEILKGTHPTKVIGLVNASSIDNISITGMSGVTKVSNKGSEFILKVNAADGNSTVKFTATYPNSPKSEPTIVIEARPAIEEVQP